MKTKFIILNRKKVLMLIILILVISLFFISLNQISLSTMNIYDPIYKGNIEKKEVAFACNVVWGNEYIPEMLKIFKENDIKITYFIGGDWATKYPEILTTIYESGHELGNHGNNHYKQSQLNATDNKNQILRAEEAIQKVTGVKTTLFAPPYGDINDLVVNVAESLSYKVIMWSIDTIDWNTKDYNKIIERIEKKHHNGAIILMHPTKVTIEALPKMIEKLKGHEYEITTVSEVIS